LDDIEFLPLGADSRAACYAGHGKDGKYFIKVKQSIENLASLRVPSFLRSAGVSNVLAPLTSNNDRLWEQAGKYGLIVYPYVAGETGKIGGMLPGHWEQFGQAVGRIHLTLVSDELRQIVSRETFEPVGLKLFGELERFAAAQPLDELSCDLRDFWKANAAVIKSVASHAALLGRQLATEKLEHVICHADMHTNNVIVDTTGSIWIVDWDETVIAPKERDLMFVVDGGISRGLVSEHAEQAFFRGYPRGNLHRAALAYYKCAWAINDIAEYASQVWLRDELPAAVREEALERFKSLFASDSIVLLALDLVVSSASNG
jgi:spectinomycin phosphotransferase